MRYEQIHRRELLRFCPSFIFFPCVMKEKSFMVIEDTKLNWWKKIEMSKLVLLASFLATIKAASLQATGGQV